MRIADVNGCIGCRYEENVITPYVYSREFHKL